MNAYICLECEATHPTPDAARTCCGGQIDWADPHTDCGGFED